MKTPITFISMADLRRPVLLVALVAVAVALYGCATPQEKAITAHCQAEGTRLIPLQTAAQQVMRPFRVGDRITGFRNTCKTINRDGKDEKGNAIKIRETVCRDDPIYEPVYEQRLVTEMVDLNQPRRQDFERACTAEALAKGMFSHLK